MKKVKTKHGTTHWVMEEGDRVRIYTDSENDEKSYIELKANQTNTGVDAYGTYPFVIHPETSNQILIEMEE